MICRKCGKEFSSLFTTVCPNCGKDNDLPFFDLFSNDTKEEPKPKQESYDPYDFEIFDNCSDREYDDNEDYDDFDN